MPYLQLMRPAQWSKNLFLFAGLIFALQLGKPLAVLKVVLAFGCFCCISSAVYILNDLHDRNEDRIHPTKRQRPLASGAASAPAALLLALVLLTVALGGGAQLDAVNHGPGARMFFVVMCAYFLLQLAYTYGLKQLAILDVILIGAGFVLRAIAGAVVIHVPISAWLVLCTFTLCLFMGFSKRRCELNVLAANGGTANVKHRKTLAEYTPELLNHMTTLTAGIAVISFLLYAMDPETRNKFGTNYLAYTLPIVVYAVFRFALLVEHGRVDGPTAVVLKDRPFQIAMALWAAAAIVIVYFGRELQTWLLGVAHDGV